MPIEFVPLHKTFAAEVRGVDISKPLSREIADELVRGADKYGVLVFRKTGLTDEQHVQFSKWFGDLDDISGYIPPGVKMSRRTRFLELFDASNMDADENVLKEHEKRYQYNKGNALWHVDSSFNPRRASYSLLLAHVLPDNRAGDTHFADVRTAFKNLPESKKEQLRGLKCAHSLWHSRNLAAPGYVAGDHEAKAKPGAVHDLVQINPDGTETMYVAAHASHVVGMDKEEGFKLIWELIDHATQPEYTLEVAWENPGDLVIWDNRAVMHRATEFEGQTLYPRDMRRTTVHDGSPAAFGHNKVYINNGVYEPTQLKSGLGNHTYVRTNGAKCLTNEGEIDGDWYLERPDLGLPRTDQKRKNPVNGVNSVNGVNGVIGHSEIKVQPSEIAAH